MKSTKTMTFVRKNLSTIFIFIIFLILMISPDAKAWFLGKIISTGLFNSDIEKKEVSSEMDTLPKLSFIIKNEEGKSIEIKNLEGKVVFLNFWASWCPPCRAEFSSVNQFYLKYKNNPKIEILTINMDEDLSKAKNYLAREKFQTPLLIPENNIPSKIYNGTLSTTVIFDKSGKIRLHHSGMADYSKESFYKQIESLLKEK